MHTSASETNCQRIGPLTRRIAAVGFVRVILSDGGATGRFEHLSFAGNAVIWLLDEPVGSLVRWAKRLSISPPNVGESPSSLSG